MLGAFAELNLVLSTVGTSFTFRERRLMFKVEVAYASVTLIKRFTWQVTEDYAHSDHEVIYIKLKTESNLKKTLSKCRVSCRVDAKVFEGNTFSVALEPDTSLNGAAIEKFTQITQCYCAQKANVLQ